MKKRGTTLFKRAERDYAFNGCLCYPRFRIRVQLCKVSNMDGLVFTCQIGALPQTTFQVSQFTLQEELSQLYSLTLKGG
ncbi:hypothetical protein QPK14_14040 [Photorhabdus temperata subsp. temperata]